MQKNLERDLKRLCDLAMGWGAAKAKAFDAQDVVIDERVRLKCQVPICSGYGASLMCPPNVMSLADFINVLTKYQRSILVQVSCPIPSEMQPMIASESTDVADLYQNEEFLTSYDESIKQAKMQLHELVNRVEAAAFSMGYRFATGLIGGQCILCEDCVAQSANNEPCRHPFRARPSMEAMGIDVFQTAANAGLPFDIPPKEITVWTGLVLVD